MKYHNITKDDMLNGDGLRGVPTNVQDARTPLH